MEYSWSCFSALDSPMQESRVQNHWNFIHKKGHNFFGEKKHAGVLYMWYGARFGTVYII